MFDSPFNIINIKKKTRNFLYINISGLALWLYDGAWGHHYGAVCRTADNDGRRRGEFHLIGRNTPPLHNDVIHFVLSDHRTHRRRSSTKSARFARATPKAKPSVVSTSICSTRSHMTNGRWWTRRCSRWPMCALITTVSASWRHFRRWKYATLAFVTIWLRASPKIHSKI